MKSTAGCQAGAQAPIGILRAALSRGLGEKVSIPGARAHSHPADHTQVSSSGVGYDVGRAEGEEHLHFAVGCIETQAMKKKTIHSLLRINIVILCHTE